MKFVYEGLDPNVDYVLRICAGFHQEELGEVIRGEIIQSLSINGAMTSEDIPLPFGEIKLFEFEVPRDIITDGRAEVVLRSQPGGFPVVGLSGMWLMVKDKMPWSLRPSQI